MARMDGSGDDDGIPGISRYNRRAHAPVGQVTVFDTTLRDGEQAPGIALSTDEKLRIAQALDDLGVDIMEAGFAASSEADRETLRRIAESGPRCTVCSLARSKKEDIDAVLGTGVGYVHTFIATSPLHMERKLRMTPDQVAEAAAATVEYARDHGLEVQFSCEDATRSDPEFLKRVYKAAEEAGACALNIPDTVGVILPSGMTSLISELKGVLKAPLSVHCHNDLGMAVANTVAAVEAGASMCHVTVNGIGERAGNAALEEVALNLYANFGIRTVDLSKVSRVSRLVERVTGFPLAFNKPIVGRNAFAHESGIHVHGVMSDAMTYEPFPPELVGADRQIVLGKHSGEHSVRGRLDAMKVRFPEERMPELMAAIKSFAVGGKEIDDMELLAIAENVLSGDTGKDKAVTLDGFAVFTGAGVEPTATVTMTVLGERKTVSGIGVGPVDAATNAIAAAVNPRMTLEEYRLSAMTGRSDSMCEVTVMVRNVQDDGELSAGTAVGLDVVRTYVEAMIIAINRDFAKNRE